MKDVSYLPQAAPFDYIILLNYTCLSLAIVNLN